MDPMAKKSHVEDSLPYVLNPSSLEGFNLERLKFHGRVPGAESLRRYGPTTSSIAVESSGWRQENLQKESPCPSHHNLHYWPWYTPLCTPPNKKVYGKTAPEGWTCAFSKAAFFQRNLSTNQNPIQFFWDGVFSAAKITTWSPIYSPVLVPAATLHPRLRHILRSNPRFAEMNS